MKIKTDRKIVFAMNVRVYLKINTRIIFNTVVVAAAVFFFPSRSPTFYSDFLDFSHSVCLSRYKVLSHCQRKVSIFSLALTRSLASTERICLSTQLLWIVCVCENVPTIPRFFYLLLYSCVCAREYIFLQLLSIEIDIPMQQQCVCDDV